MRFVLALGILVALAAAQTMSPAQMMHVMSLLTEIKKLIPSNWRVESHHGGDHHLFLFIDDNPEERICYVVTISHSWDSLLSNHNTLLQIAEEMSDFAKNAPEVVAPLENRNLIDTYQDFQAARECQGHATYVVRYVPSALGSSA
ncbi:uncharacterized protein LOC112577045 [Pomacea canaliculata]|uniref:uncharacterized protein LOC112577045 n=1 Tax=Pomacea canaliculata TaxID=400727 RepID=UPI000D7303A6|nr:uncharacterized protein LOC112577045 [Pomacea canaliculata]